MTKEEYKKLFGSEPIQDDLDRVNCQEVGKIGHFQCGICSEHDKPRFQCGCFNGGVK